MHQDHGFYYTQQQQLEFVHSFGVLAYFSRDFSYLELSTIRQISYTSNKNVKARGSKSFRSRDLFLLFWRV